MAWRLAKSLETLRSQVNATYPNRSKASDGTIGDAAHRKEVSDHNPNAAGVVTAFDLTHDPAHGVDIVQIAEAIRTDPRVKYLIRNSQILITANGQNWVAYKGSNPHTKHLHISVKSNPYEYDEPRQWNISKGGNMSAQAISPNELNDVTGALWGVNPADPNHHKNWDGKPFYEAYMATYNDPRTFEYADKVYKALNGGTKYKPYTPPELFVKE